MQGELIRKEQCKECAAEGRDTKHDNLHIYADGGRWCIAGHGGQGFDSELAGENQEEEETITIKGDMLSGEYVELPSRGISRDTCIKYGYQVSRDPVCQIANFFDVAKNVMMQKLRFAGKRFEVRGDRTYNSVLYGSWLWTPDDRVFVTIAEGELDALSIAEVFNCRYPVVSLPNGVGDAKKLIQKHKDYLSGFKYVVLAFDNDEPGRKATQECLEVLEPGTARVVNWGEAKDANELLQEGKHRQLQKSIYDAVEYIPEPIKTGDRLLATLDGYKTRTHEWPWKSANRTIQPIHVPGLYSIAAKPAVGKTSFVADLMRAYISTGSRVGVVSLEETIQKVLLKMTSALKNIDLLSIHNRDYTDEEKELCVSVAQDLVVYDHITYGSDIDVIVNHIPYMVRTCGCDLIVFDNITASATTSASEERLGIDKAMRALHETTVKYEYTLINVCHLKRDAQSLLEGERPPSIEEIRGSQGVELYSDFVLGLARKTRDNDETVRNTLEVHMLKDRLTGNDTGKSFNLHFNHTSGRFEDAPENILV